MATRPRRSRRPWRVRRMRPKMESAIMDERTPIVDRAGFGDALPVGRHCTAQQEVVVTKRPRPLELTISRTRQHGEPDLVRQTIFRFRAQLRCRRRPHPRNATLSALVLEL